jgi:hypothetical protein
MISSISQNSFPTKMRKHCSFPINTSTKAQPILPVILVPCGTFFVHPSHYTVSSSPLLRLTFSMLINILLQAFYAAGKIPLPLATASTINPIAVMIQNPFAFRGKDDSIICLLRLGARKRVLQEVFDVDHVNCCQDVVSWKRS